MHKLQKSKQNNYLYDQNFKRNNALIQLERNQIKKTYHQLMQNTI